MKLVNNELKEIMKFLDDKVEGKDFILAFNNKTFMNIIDRKKKEYNEFQEVIKSRWQDFNLNNKKKVVKGTYITFFYDNLNDFLRKSLTIFYGLDENSLKFLNVEKISDSNLITECEYYLSPEEENEFNELAMRVGEHQYPFEYYVGYFFFAISSIGVILRTIIQENFFVLLDGVVLKTTKKGHILHLMVIVRDDKEEMYKNYLKMSLIYFLKQYPDIPSNFKESLMQGREALYQIALSDYSKQVPERLTELMYYIYKKSKLIQNFTPLLDFLNFVCSRLEDSKFSKIDIIRKEFLANLDYTEEKKKFINKIFRVSGL